MATHLTDTIHSLELYWSEMFTARFRILEDCSALWQLFLSGCLFSWRMHFSACSCQHILNLPVRCLCHLVIASLKNHSTDWCVELVAYSDWSQSPAARRTFARFKSALVFCAISTLLFRAAIVVSAGQRRSCHKGFSINFYISWTW